MGWPSRSERAGRRIFPLAEGTAPRRGSAAGMGSFAASVQVWAADRGQAATSAVARGVEALVAGGRVPAELRRALRAEEPLAELRLEAIARLIGLDPALAVLDYRSLLLDGGPLLERCLRIPLRRRAAGAGGLRLSALKPATE